MHDTAEAVKIADVIMVGIPDTKQAAAYNKDIGPNSPRGRRFSLPMALASTSRRSFHPTT